jgi:hypothetical protein
VDSVLKQQRPDDLTRREVLKKSAWVAPAILTLKASPSFASNGSSSDTAPDQPRRRRSRRRLQWLLDEDD